MVDTDILINLCHVRRLSLFGALPAYNFVVPDQVIAEITISGQQALVTEALKDGHLQQQAVTDLVAIAEYARLSRVIGKGEAACLALAHLHGWQVLSADRRRPFTREAQQLLPAGSLFGMVELYVWAIKAGALTVAEADKDVEILRQNRFDMRISSFADLI